MTLQDICPGRVVEHLGLVADALVFALVVDALDAEGPADPVRIDRSVRARPFPADAQPGAVVPLVQAASGAALGTLLAPPVAAEPEPRCYVDATCAVPELRLTRRCVGDGKLRMNVVSDSQLNSTAEGELTGHNPGAADLSAAGR